MACSLASDSPSWRATVSPMPCSSTRRRHAARHRLAGHELRDQERAADEVAVGAHEVHVGHGDAALLGDVAHRGLGVDRVDDRLAERDDRGHEVVGHAAGRRLEQHVVAPRPGRRLRQVADLDVLAPLLTEVGGQPGRDIDSHVTHLPRRSWPGLATCRSLRVISTIAGQARASNASSSPLRILLGERGLRIGDATRRAARPAARPRGRCWPGRAAARARPASRGGRRRAPGAGGPAGPR